MSFRHLLLLFLAFISHFSMLLLLYFRSLVRLASLSSLFPFGFGPRVAVFAWAVLRGDLAALCLVSQLSVRSRGALLRRLDLRRCACDSKLFYGRSCTPLPTPIISPLSRCTGALQCSRSLALLLVGRTGMVASVEETESSASSTSSGRHSAVLPIVGPPRGLLARVS